HAGCPVGRERTASTARTAAIQVARARAGVMVMRDVNGVTRPDLIIRDNHGYHGECRAGVARPGVAGTASSANAGRERRVPPEPFPRRTRAVPCSARVPSYTGAEPSLAPARRGDARRDSSVVIPRVPIMLTPV